MDVLLISPIDSKISMWTKRMMKFYSGRLSLLSIALLAAGCGGSQPKALVAVAVSPQSAVVTDGQVVQFTANVTGDASGVTWAVNGTAGGGATTGVIDSSGKYTAPAATSNSTVTVSATSKVDPSKTASASVTVVAPGVVAASANVQVAAYTISPPTGAMVSVQFGPDANYGLTTWQQPAAMGGPVTILVAGMKLSSTYHMRAVLKLADNTELDDVDHTFVTGVTAAGTIPIFTATTTAGAVPQSGVELLTLVSVKPTVPGAVTVTDLGGNILWSYDAVLPGLTPNPAKLLPNGHFLINYNAPTTDGLDSVLREIDLSGQVIWEMTAAQLNQALAAATCTGCNITVIGTHHDFTLLPNGHLIVIASQSRTEAGLTGFPNPVNVLGDVLIDLDQNHNPVWVWSTFDHLDVNRHPMSFPDWIHANSVNYSPDDKALILSMRHQHWVVKIDYNDGQGAGDILWKLGYQGDFTLVGGTDPQDWFYAQHDANIVSAKSSGVLDLLLFDNGDNRVLDSVGTICGPTTTPCHSRVPIWHLDETAKTATIQWVDNLSPVYSTFGGSARMLPNEHIEFAECAPIIGLPIIYEVTQTTPPQVVWQMHMTMISPYRGTRIPSFYPGVQW